MNTEPEEDASGPNGPAVFVRRGRKDRDPNNPDAPAEGENPADAASPAAVAETPGDSHSLDALLQRDPSLLESREHGGSALEASDLASSEAAAAELSNDFAAMLAAHGLPSQKPGDRLRGTVVSITSDSVFVDVGGKSEAFIDRRELLDEHGELTVKEGQVIEAQVIHAGADGLRLSYGALRAHKLSEELAEAAQSGIAVEGKVVGFNDGGLEVRIGGRRAFCPRSQVDRSVPEDLSGFVGRNFSFLVTRFDPTGRKIVLSRRTLLEREAKAKAEETRKTLEPGAILEGVVRKVMPFGVFVDLGGVDGLVHVSELSWSHVEDPKTLVSEGQPLKVKVLRIDADKDRIALSARQAEGDPWDTVRDRFEQGRSYAGKVTRLAEFGAFVELAPGVEGLVHVTEIDWKKRINHPRDALSVGQDVTVAALEIDPGKRRLALSIKQAGEDPWAGMGEGVVPGAGIEVTVEKVAEFGVFCTIAEGVNGLIPNSQMNTPRGSNHRREFPPGTKLQVQVMEVDRRARKITLSRKALEEGGAASDFRDYQKQVKKEQKAGPSALELAFLAARDRAGKK
jgi:small subunit ribosomal protein S1